VALPQTPLEELPALLDLLAGFGEGKRKVSREWRGRK